MKNSILLIAGLASLSACAVTPTANGGYQISSSVGQMLNQVVGNGATNTSSAAAPVNTGNDALGNPILDATGPTMTFQGPIDGGNATATLTPLGGGDYYFSISAAGKAVPGGPFPGMGGVDGKVTGDGQTFMMTQGDEKPNPQPCSINLTMSGNTLSVAEGYKAGGCMAFHNGALSFDGTLTRTS
jgi:hypothetical protein